MRIKSFIFELFLLPLIFFLGILIIAIFPNIYCFAILGTILVTILYVYSERLQLFDDVDIPKVETLHNQTIENAIEQIHNLLSIANEQVIIVSGGLNHKIWNNVKIINDLISVIHRGITVEILIGPKINAPKDSKLYKFLKENIGGSNLKLYVLSKKPDTHFIIVDNAHVRLEKNHDERKIDREALIKIYGVGLAGRAKVKYEDYRLKSSIINKNTFSELKCGDIKNA